MRTMNTRSGGRAYDMGKRESTGTGYGQKEYSPVQEVQACDNQHRK